MTPYYASLAVAILFGILGQITLKAGALAAPTVIAQFQNPLTILGLGIYIGAAFFYVIALKKIPVSVAFPTVAVSYAVLAVVAHLMWDEPFGWAQLGGLLLIGSGVVLIHQY